MNLNKIYSIQIISVLIVLLIISIYVLYEKNGPEDYNYGTMIFIQEKY